MKSAKALPRYGSGHKSARRMDGRTDGRTTPNVTSKVFTRFPYSHIKKPYLPNSAHVIEQTGIIFKLRLDVISTNVLSKFHDD